MKTVWIHIRWFLIVASTAILSLTAYIVFPVAFLIRKPIRKARNSKFWLFRFLALPLWIYLDDEDGDYGAIWWLVANGYEDTFITAYKWAVLRNPIWNIHSLITTKQGREVIVNVYIDKLQQMGKRVSALEFARYRWIDKDGFENSNSNSGYSLSLKNSIIGTSYVIYKVANTYYFRYSTARPFKLFGLKRLLQIKLGNNEKRYLVQFKIQKPSKTI